MKPGPIIILLAVVCVATTPACTASESRDIWFTVQAEGTKVGWLHSTRDQVMTEGDAVLLRSREEARIEMNRFGERIAVATEHTFWETPDGRPVRFVAKSRMSSVETVVEGVVKADGLQLTTTNVGAPSTATVPWEPGILFPAAADRLARAKGLAPGTTFSFRTYSPDLSALDTITVRVVGPEEAEVEGGKRRLTKVVSAQGLLPGQETILWVDDEGEEQRIDAPVLSFRFLRTTEEIAKSALREKTPAPDLALGTVIPIDAPFPRPYDSTRALYRLRLREGSLDGIELEGPGQTARRQDDGSVLVEVGRVEPPSAPVRAPGAELAEYLAGSSYVQKDDRKIRAIAEEAARGGKDPWRKAKGIESWVATHLREKNLDVGFATAAEVARNLEGDCTEHAILTAALLRAAGIPSRVAVGLVFFEGRFGYHMWTEAWVGGWMSLDATIAGDLVDAAHIRLGSSALVDTSPLASIAQLNRVLGRLSIDLLEVEWTGGERWKAKAPGPPEGGTGTTEKAGSGASALVDTPGGRR